MIFMMRRVRLLQARLQLVLPLASIDDMAAHPKPECGGDVGRVRAARATCAITLGAVSGYAVTNGGFGYTHPPDVFFLGGGYAGNTAVSAGFPGFAAPGQSGDPTGSHPAKAHAVLTADVVTPIVTEDAGSGYGIAPFLVHSSSGAGNRFGAPILR